MSISIKWEGLQYLLNFIISERVEFPICYMKELVEIILKKKTCTVKQGVTLICPCFNR